LTSDSFPVFNLYRTVLSDEKRDFKLCFVVGVSIRLTAVYGTAYPISL
jgi:hypothetical protein